MIGFKPGTFSERNILKYALCIVAGFALALLLYWLTPQKAHAAAYSYQYLGQTGNGGIPKAGKQVSLTIRNTGTSPWCKACPTPTRLGTDRPRDRLSGFLDGTLSLNRVEMDQAVVMPGQDATFTFNVKRALSHPGQLNEYFTPVVDGVTWMTDIGQHWPWITPAPVGIHVFHWYGASGFRWYQGFTSGVPEWAVDTPVGGIYGSSDETRMRNQIEQIKNAGFDFPIFNYWEGTGPYGQGGTIRAHAKRMAEIARDEYGMKVSFLIDNPTGGVVQQSTYDDLAPFASAMFRWKDQAPTIFVYGGRSQPNPQGIIAIEYDNVEPDPRTNTMYWVLEPARIKNRMLTIMPSFSNLHWCSGVTTCLAYDGAQTGWLWNNQSGLAMAQRGSLDVLVEYSLNEHGERSGIEGSTAPDRQGNGPWRAWTWAANLLTAWNSP